MIVGRRTNVLLSNNSQPLYLPDDVTAAARQRGKLFVPNAEDYFFIALNDFPWHLVADVVVGRPAYDNYLVGLAIQQNVTVVDATRSILAVHQTDRDGDYAGHRHDDYRFNGIRIGPFLYCTGWTTSAQYVTNVTTNEFHNLTKVTVVKRPKIRVPFRAVSTPTVTRRPNAGVRTSVRNQSSTLRLYSGHQLLRTVSVRANRI